MTIKIYKNLKNRWIKNMFKPNIFSPFINPFFIIRTYLYFSIKRASQKVQGNELLDFGCGKKPYRNLFSVSKYIGLDIELGSHANQFDNVDIYFDGKHIPLPSNSFDIILSTEVFEHVFNLDQTLLELKRVLRNDGFMIVTIPFFWEEHEEPFDFARYTSFGFESLVRSHGFEIVNMEKTGNESFVLCQLLINAFWKLTYKLLNVFALFILPIYSIFFISVFILPAILEMIFSKNKKIYFNNVFVLKNIK